MHPRYSSRVLDRLYAMPRPCDLHEEWLRQNHLDLPLMTTEELADERVRLCIRLAYERAPNAWLRDRLARVNAARGARR